MQITNQQTKFPPEDNNPFKNPFGQERRLGEILDSPPDEERFLVEPLLSRGDKGYLVAGYKAGKTLFLAQLALCLAMGKPFLGLRIPEPAKVLYIRFELKDSRFYRRLHPMVKGLGGRDMIKIEPVFQLARGFDIMNEEHLSWLLYMINRYDAEVLLLDPFYKMVRFDLKQTENAMPLILRMDSILTEFPDLLMMISHHNRKELLKGGQASNWDSTYGPMFLFADMDYEIKLTRAGGKKDPHFTLSCLSNDIPVEPMKVYRDPDTLIYKRFVTPISCTDYSESVVDFLAKNPTTRTNLKTWLNKKFEVSDRKGKEIIEKLLEDKTITLDKGKGKGTRGKLIVPVAATTN